MSVRNTPRKPPAERRARYAGVGAGWIWQEDFMPGVGDQTKAKTLAKRYGISHLYHYDDYEKMLESGRVDAVYLAFPIRCMEITP
jgi:predicted dehydrogenase